MEQLMHEIHDYWSDRARGYSEYNQEEQKDERYSLWREELASRIGAAFPDKEPWQIRVLDAGAGPGFFTGILAECGYDVTALDCTEAMLEEARINLGEKADRVRFVLSDVEKTFFEDMSFDVIVSRNVTWNLRRPDRVYGEWFRLLEQGGLLLIYDANWYQYLFDDEKRKEYEQDRVRTRMEEINDANEGVNFDRMEDIARQIPLSSVSRPGWDEKALLQTGYNLIETDTEIWNRLWSHEEKINWASTPMFLISARKSDIKKRVVEYWTKRSESFMEQRRQELHNEISQRWLSEILPYLPDRKPLSILDVGCGSGFFSILLAGEGHVCTGIDLTPDMIREAEILNAEEKQNCVFHVMDAENLKFEDETFDVVISRNLTWTLPHPEMAYREWLRVLKPGGILLNIDANYGLEKTAAMDELPHDHAHHTLGHEMLEENDTIKKQLPISFRSRPAWDLEILGKSQISRVSVDYRTSRRIYLEKDIFYNPTALFLLAVWKEHNPYDKC